MGIGRWKARVRELKTDIYALYLAYKDPRTPWHARLAAAVVVGYALSPIDLIPDPIPVLGYLDDLILLPLGLMLVRKLIPRDVLEKCRIRAREETEGRLPASRAAAVVIAVIWLLLAIWIVRFGLKFFPGWR